MNLMAVKMVFEMINDENVIEEWKDVVAFVEVAFVGVLIYGSYMLF